MLSGFVFYYSISLYYSCYVSLSLHSSAQSIFIALKRLMLAAPVDVVARGVEMSTAGRKVGI